MKLNRSKCLTDVQDAQILIFKVMGHGVAGCYKALSFMLPALLSMIFSGSSICSMLGVNLVLCVLFHLSSVSSIVCFVIKCVGGVSQGVLKKSVYAKLKCSEVMSRPKKRGGSSRSSRRCYRKLRRRLLHICLVQCCYARSNDPSLLGPHIRIGGGERSSGIIHTKPNAG